GGIPRGDGHARVRLRHLPGSLSVERDRPRVERSCLAAAPGLGRRLGRRAQRSIGLGAAQGDEKELDAADEGCRTSAKSSYDALTFPGKLMRLRWSRNL